MGDKNLNIEEKKKQLEAELVRLENDIETSVSNLKQDAIKQVSLVNLVKKYPVTVLSAAVVVGYIAAGKRVSKKTVSSNTKHLEDFTPNEEPTVSSLIKLELKRLLTQKAISLATDYIESFIDSNSKSKQNK